MAEPNSTPTTHLAPGIELALTFGAKCSLPLGTVRAFMAMLANEPDDAELYLMPSKPDDICPDQLWFGGGK